MLAWDPTLRAGKVHIVCGNERAQLGDGIQSETHGCSDQSSVIILLGHLILLTWRTLVLL